MAGYPKTARLLTPAQFDYVFKNGKRMGSGPFLAVVANSPVETPRLGFALAKRQAKTAVQRNRLRRQLREQFRLAQPQLLPMDIVISLRAKPGDDRANEAQALATFWAMVLKRCSRSP